MTASVCGVYRNPEILNECEIDDATREKLLENIRRRLTPQAVKIRAGWSNYSCFHTTFHICHDFLSLTAENILHVQNEHTNIIVGIT